MSEELGMKCPKCGRVCRAEIVDNGQNVVGLAHCCGWAFDGWPDTPTPKTFAEELQCAAGTLTATQIAAATGASKRTVEGWRAGKEPPQAYRADILTRIKRARARAERRQSACAMQAPNTFLAQNPKKVFRAGHGFQTRFDRIRLLHQGKL